MGESERSVSGLGLPREFASFIKNDWGIDTLHPPQADAIPSIIQGKNTMVCIPTASGKSLVAYIGIV
ncbi:MAG: DEAD/DEAH box helicase, partial [Candidatus Poseidoniaceae archaeon]|nr:DEAD/DEAH box helicase [Candidatus Poseidoniaceae archaeon]